KRYPSVAALAQDVRRYIEGKPIEALPARFTDRVRKFVRRNRPMVGVTATAVVAILAAIGYSLHRETVTQAKNAAKAVAILAPTPPDAPVTANLAAPVTTAPAHSIVVLPFVDMSEKKDQEYFADGLSEQLIYMLAKVPGLHVPARTSSFYFKGKQTTIAAIA